MARHNGWATAWEKHMMPYHLYGQLAISILYIAECERGSAVITPFRGVLESAREVNQKSSEFGATMGLLNLCMKKNPFSRAFHFSLLVPCVVLVIMAAVSLGTFVPMHLDIRDYEGSGDNDQPLTCVLFATLDRDNTQIDYRDDTTCDFLIWGQVAVGSLGIAIGAVLIVKAFIGTKVFSVFALVELILTAIGFLFTLALGIIITIGTDDTCTAFNAINKEKGEPFTPCEEYEYAEDSGIQFYGPLNTSRIVTWVEAVVLFLLLIWYVFVSLINCCTWCNSRGPKQPKI